ncbi:metabolite traffic protein EboE [Tuwongella immobilis]|uniref:Xylose isomerase-like TIM barrel domain-containing protein n=1 Tax=Tuwongella immobilis TaxID=692036 RepID=A0A6C2YTY2_9BACT|nr:metabolite traffic protein EboE [Tuwongella immobilis]VIP04375.1 Uncharacterized protein OS=Pirellula staleyi (strain ATCC 27377 / DSM 6068 / ICPB 4128) GN=Psta_2731 PE=4 SV=1 [Tuwongella immobilis]VTS06112.1 Uncharacterized protein OS=Pirellula staleyi (strain ATCC 27377 / DSM 6068 / ICPB 4128) GN=Psta_2731 PE=4 SV=1 [Tuwongella immobilis]
MSFATGYCTNVHAGANLAQARANLAKHATAVRRSFAPDQTIGVGLWLSASAARELRHGGGGPEWRDWLASEGLVPFTFNGFPYGDFHDSVVQLAVYLPTWADPKRLDYTRDLVAIQHALLPAGMTGSISTLPLAWSEPAWGESDFAAAVAQLRQLAEELRQLEAESGRRIILSIEPEPGCLLERGAPMVRFFEEHLLRGAADEASIRRHIGICHDICHAAVMFEPQAEVIAGYRRAGLTIGKVQVSSAVSLRLDRLESRDHAAAFEQLATFAEPRYLHQTLVQSQDGTLRQFVNLPDALAHGDRQAREWRTHFHVPIYLERFGHLHATQEAIHDCLRAMVDLPESPHFEVETYAWTVLPAEMQVPELAAGIAEELRWFSAQQAW